MAKGLEATAFSSSAFHDSSGSVLPFSRSGTEGNAIILNLFVFEKNIKILSLLLCQQHFVQ